MYKSCEQKSLENAHGIQACGALIEEDHIRCHFCQQETGIWGYTWDRMNPWTQLILCRQCRLMEVAWWWHYPVLACFLIVSVSELFLPVKVNKPIQFSTIHKMHMHQLLTEAQVPNFCVVLIRLEGRKNTNVNWTRQLWERPYALGQYFICLRFIASLWFASHCAWSNYIQLPWRWHWDTATPAG